MGTTSVGMNGEGEAGEAANRDPGRALCDVFLRSLPVTGASISVVTESGHHSIVGASDDLATKLEAWQFELGVGPHWDALRTECPAFVYDVADVAEQGSWPSLATDAVRSGAAALFAFPLRLGASTVGVADLYSRSSVDRWPDETVELAEHLALRVSAPAVRLATCSADAETSRIGPSAVELRREVHQATGMVMAQLDCSAGTALLRLRGHAFATGVPLEALAREVIKRHLDFSGM